MESTLTQQNMRATANITIPSDTAAGSVTGNWYCSLYHFLVEGILNIALCMFGLIGNSLTLMVVWKDRKKSATAYLLIVLAVVDNLVLVVWGVVRASYAIPVYTMGSYLYIYGYIMHYGVILGHIVNLMSTWAVVMVTMVRYISVCLPHRSNHWLKPTLIHRWSFLVIFSCFLVMIPRVFSGRVRYVESLGRMQFYRYSWTRGTTYSILYLSFLISMVMYVAPLSILLFCTCKLIQHLSKASKRREEMTTQSREQKDITFSLVVVVVVFFICQIATPIQRIWAETTPRSKMFCPHAFFYYRSVANTAPVLNSAINFAIFVLCGRGFRTQVLALICGNRKVHPMASGSANTSSGNATTTYNQSSTVASVVTASVKPTQETV